MRGFLRTSLHNFQAFQFNPSSLASEVCLTAFESLVSLCRSEQTPINSVVFWNIRKAGAERAHLDILEVIRSNNLIFINLDNLYILFLIEKLLRYRSNIFFYLGSTFRTNGILTLTNLLKRKKLNYITYNSKLTFDSLAVIKQRKLVYLI